MTERERRDVGEPRLEILERAGYVWRATPPEGFWNAEKSDLIDYADALDATFAELAQRIATGHRWRPSSSRSCARCSCA